MEFVVTMRTVGENARAPRHTTAAAALVCDESASEILGECACEMLAGTAVAPVI
jgi:hypothetical protein